MLVWTWTLLKDHSVKPTMSEASMVEHPTLMNRGRSFGEAHDVEKTMNSSQ